MLSDNTSCSYADKVFLVSISSIKMLVSNRVVVNESMMRAAAAAAAAASAMDL